MSLRRTNRVLYVCLLTLGFVLLPFAGRAFIIEPPTAAYRLADPVSHFLLDIKHPDYVVSWGTDELNYARVGNVVGDLSPEIDSALSTISASTGLRFHLASPSAIYFLYERDVFRQIKDDGSRLVASGFSDKVVEELHDDFAGMKDLKCLSQHVVDDSHDIVSAFVISENGKPNCLQALIYESVGLRDVTDRDAPFYACMLYAARKQGAIKVQSIMAIRENLYEHCARFRG